MPGGKNNTQRIETLEGQAANLVARLDVLDTLIRGLKALLDKNTETTEKHISKLTVVEQTLVMVDLKTLQPAINELEKQCLAIKKDIETLQKWKDDLRKEKEESVRRLWSFGPSIVAAMISGIITLVGIGINIALTYWLKKQ